MVGKAVATMVCYNEQTYDKEAQLGTYLVKSGQKNTTHEARKNYPETVFREDMTFIRFPSRSGSIFLSHWNDFMG